ncbi:hypothetical protein [Mycoplasmopsis bovis]|uniref:hypothetical protein n=1 Tax=Mycoplasmopsis bovis TaxID=28903 RepID=UPI003D27A028
MKEHNLEVVRRNTGGAAIPGKTIFSFNLKWFIAQIWIASQYAPSLTYLPFLIGSTNIIFNL